MIKTVEAERILPFRDKVALNLAGRGVVLIRGDVQISAATDSNGAGKTAAASLISVGYFGEDLAGRKGTALVNRFTGGPGTVRIVTEDALGEWTVTRTVGPSSLKVTGIDGVLENEDMKVLQAKIEDRLGFGIRTFKNAVVFGQGAFERFAQADQAEQMRMLDEIQGLDLRDGLKSAKDWRDGLKYKLGEADRDLEHAEGNVEAWRADIGRKEEVRDAFEGQRVVTVDRLRGELDEAGRRRSASEKDLELVDMKRASADVLRADVETERVLALEVGKFQEAHRQLEAELDKATDAKEDLEGRLTELLDSGACPACRRPTVKSQRAAIKKLFAAEFDELDAAIKAASAPCAAALRVFEAGRKRLGFARSVAERIVPEHRRDNVERYLRELENECSPEVEKAKRATLALVTERIKKVKAELQTAQDEAWSGDADLRDARRQLAASQADVVAAEELRAKLAAAVAMADYCVETLGDRGLRSMMVDGVADYVNERTAAHLEVLACGEASVRMSATTELKKGGARESISFHPSWSWGGDGEGSGSGGQDRRVDLAVFAATQDLAESHGARPFPIKIYDEVFDALDGRGQELAVQWIKRQARERGTILLITHSKEMEALVDPDVTWTVVMGRDGAHVVES